MEKVRTKKELYDEQIDPKLRTLGLEIESGHCYYDKSLESLN